jgi:hypothetical protein
VKRELDSSVRRDQPGRGRRRNRGPDRGTRLRLVAALTVLAIWAGTTVPDLISATYNPPDGINTVALAAATYLFGSAFFKENNDR